MLNETLAQTSSVFQAAQAAQDCQDCRSQNVCLPEAL